MLNQETKTKAKSCKRKRVYVKSIKQYISDRPWTKLYNCKNTSMASISST